MTNDKLKTESEAATGREASAVERLVILPMPEGFTRIETGAVQFGDDWPGVFIRGDHAGYYAMQLRNAAEIMECNDPGHVMDAMTLKILAELFESSRAI